MILFTDRCKSRLCYPAGPRRSSIWWRPREPPTRAPVGSVPRRSRGRSATRRSPCSTTCPPLPVPVTDALDKLEYQYYQQNYHQYGYNQVQRPAPHPNLTSLSFGRQLAAIYTLLDPTETERVTKRRRPRPGTPPRKGSRCRALTSSRPCHLASLASPPRARPPRRRW